MHKTLSLAALALLIAAPFALAGGALPTNAVVNGDFELNAERNDVPVVDDVLDVCLGVGHQVFFGSDTLPGRLAEGDVDGAADKLTMEDTVKYAGYDHCVADSRNGVDLAWLNPSRLSRDEAVHWSNPTGTTFDDFDGDGDREVMITAAAGRHNLWQAYPSPFQAFTADFDAFEFRIENDVAPVGVVRLSLSATPIAAQTPYVGLWQDCVLSFPATTLQANLAADGLVRVDPADGRLGATDPACEDAAAAFNADDATAEDRHAALAGLRIVQLSFWDFEQAGEDVVLDDVAIVNARTAAEALTAMQVNPHLDG